MAVFDPFRTSDGNALPDLRVRNLAPETGQGQGHWRRKLNGSGAAMKRREFIAFLSGAAAWPLGVRAQQSAPSALPRIGLLFAVGTGPALNGIVGSLAERGYFDATEHRFQEIIRDPHIAPAAESWRCAGVVILRNVRTAVIKVLF
jgi:hypothetical protein